MKTKIHISLSKIRTIIVVVSVIIICCSFSYRQGFKRGSVFLANQSGILPKADLSLFWSVWDRIGNKFLDRSTVNSKEMIYGAISGMVASLEDPYTVFLPPTENKLTQEDLSGEFGGVGIQLGYRDGSLAVMAPLKDTPAERAGIKAGDLILRIVDKEKAVDKEAKDVSLPEAVAYIRGKPGTKVTLVLFRKEKEPKETELVREKIQVPSIQLVWQEKNSKKIAHIKLLGFTERLFDDWKETINEILKVQKEDNSFAGVILDVRDNPGGYLQGAIDVASEFISSGVIVQQEGTDKKETFNVNRRGRLIDVPLVVLVNKGSASASEILAGALQEYKRAVLIGEKTFGKGTIQEPEELPEGTGLHITVAKWLLPSGKNIHKEGIVPDIIVENKDVEEGDLQLEKAVEEVLKENGG